MFYLLVVISQSVVESSQYTQYSMTTKYVVDILLKGK